MFLKPSFYSLCILLPLHLRCPKPRVKLLWLKPLVQPQLIDHVCMRSLLPKRWHFCCLYCYIFSALYLPQCLITLRIRLKLVNGFIKHSMTTKVLILKPSFFRLLRLQMLLLALRRVFPSTRRSTQR